MSSSSQKQRTTIYILSELWKKFKSICDREGEKASSKIESWILTYVIQHEPGNPQRLITTYIHGNGLIPALRFRLCKYSGYYADAHGPISRPICRAKRFAFIGVNYELCEKCKQFKRKITP